MGVVHKLRLQILAFLDPTSPWLTALLDKICQFYLVSLKSHETHSHIAVNVVCEWPQNDFWYGPGYAWHLKIQIVNWF